MIQAPIVYNSDVETTGGLPGLLGGLLFGGLGRGGSGGGLLGMFLDRAMANRDMRGAAKLQDVANKNAYVNDIDNKLRLLTEYGKTPEDGRTNLEAQLKAKGFLPSEYNTPEGLAETQGLLRGRADKWRGQANNDYINSHTINGQGDRKYEFLDTNWKPFRGKVADVDSNANQAASAVNPIEADSHLGDQAAQGAAAGQQQAEQAAKSIQGPGLLGTVAKIGATFATGGAAPFWQGLAKGTTMAGNLFNGSGGGSANTASTASMNKNGNGAPADPMIRQDVLNGNNIPKPAMLTTTAYGNYGGNLWNRYALR